jgi:tetratricopeptide (TPR) repeat protein
MDEFSSEVNKMLSGLDKLLESISLTDERYKTFLGELQALIKEDLNVYLAQQNIGRFVTLLKFAERIFPSKDPNFILWLLADQVFHISLRLPVSESLIRDASLLGAELRQNKDLTLASLGCFINAIVALIRIDLPRVLRNLIDALNCNILSEELFNAMSGLFLFIPVSPEINYFVNFAKRIRMFMKTGDLMEKHQKAEDFIERYPLSILGYAMKATLLMDEGKFNEALIFAEKMWEINKDMPTSFLLKGTILDHLGKLDEVAILIEKMLAYNPKLLKVIEPTYFPHFSKTSGFFKYKTGALMSPSNP